MGKGQLRRPGGRLPAGHGNPARQRHIRVMPNLKNYPFYLRSTVILFGLVLCSYALANLRGILIPFSFALLLAVLLNPLTDRFQQWKIPRILAIAVSLIVAIVVI